MKYSINILKKIKILILISFVLFSSIIISCKKEHYDYMSDNNKQFFFYNLYDTLIFQNETDTLIGVVSKKEFSLNEMRYPLQNGLYYEEEGLLKISNIINNEIIVSISSLNQLGTITMYYKFNNESFKFYSDSSVSHNASFSKRIKTEKEIPIQEILTDDKSYMNIFYELTIANNGCNNINFNNVKKYNIKRK